MASTSAASTSVSFTIPVSEKLTRDNFLVWRAQVLPAVRAARLVGILDGSSAEPSPMIQVEKPDKSTEKVENPAYVQWIAQDQQVLSFLLSSMTKEILVQVSSLEHTAEVWKAITEMFSSQSKSRVLQLRSQLSRMKKGDLSASSYYTKMKGLADEMAAAGKKLDDDDIIEYILNGLDAEYNPFVSSMTIKDNVSLSDLYAQLLSYEARLLQQNQDGGHFYSSANSASRGQGQGRARGPGRGQIGSGRGSNKSSSNHSFDDQDEAPLCQLCERTGHTVHNCWYRFNRKYVPPSNGVGGARQPGSSTQKSVSSAVPSYGIDSNWYMDSGSTDHITSELDKLTTRERYHGGDQILAADGKGMSISHIGKSVIRTTMRDFSFNNTLHVLSAQKNLVSVQKFTTDNDVFLEFHPTFFCVKDLHTKNLLLQGRCQDGLYPLPSSTAQTYHVVKPSISRWHHRLGHPSSIIVDRVIRDNNLSFSREFSLAVCVACQQAKSHQLPYPKSTSVSSYPLELIFSDVWGPAPQLVGRYQYYVSFIDDFSKFTWIYLLRNRSEVFLNFQQHVERLFNRKIITMQTDWGVEYQKLNSFFPKDWHRSSCLLSSCSSAKWLG